MTSFHLYFLLIPILTISVMVAQDDKSAETLPKVAENSDQKKETQRDIQKSGKIKIGSQEIDYSVTTGKIALKNDKGEKTASIFHTSYKREGVANAKQRPVMFAFNGGPGSSSVWLHLGILGPRRIDFSGDGTTPQNVPARLIDNDLSILDECDLVFIDPVSTGYSRAQKDAELSQFHGLEADIQSVGEFIRIWVTENDRWSSPKYLCGESYGGIRAAGLADHLQNRYGMSLNGVILLSSLLDFQTIFETQGSPLSYQVFLPAFSATAHFHGKIQGDREKILQDARSYAFGEYGQALGYGSDLPTTELEKHATRLESLTGISRKIWMLKKLRMSAFEFRKELLRDEGKVIGRFDARVAWDSTDPAAISAEYDPSYTLALGMFSTAMLAYLGDELGWKEDQAYEILTEKVRPWSYSSDNRVVNVTNRLSDALRDNPKLKVLVMGAHVDLATPAEGVPYSIRQEVHLPVNLRKQFTFTYYEAGHMFYINPPDLIKSRKDLLTWLRAE